MPPRIEVSVAPASCSDGTCVPRELAAPPPVRLWPAVEMEDLSVGSLAAAIQVAPPPIDQPIVPTRLGLSLPLMGLPSRLASPRNCLTIAASCTPRCCTESCVVFESIVTRAMPCDARNGPHAAYIACTPVSGGQNTAPPNEERSPG